MQRRDFIQITGATLAALVLPKTSRAQEAAQSSTSETTQNHVVKARPPIELVPEKDVTIIAGFSDGRTCTYSDHRE